MINGNIGDYQPKEIEGAPNRKPLEVSQTGNLKVGDKEYVVTVGSSIVNLNATVSEEVLAKIHQILEHVQDTEFHTAVYEKGVIKTYTTQVDLDMGRPKHIYQVTGQSRATRQKVEMKGIKEEISEIVESDEVEIDLEAEAAKIVMIKNPILQKKEEADRKRVEDIKRLDLTTDLEVDPEEFGFKVLESGNYDDALSTFNEIYEKNPGVGSFLLGQYFEDEDNPDFDLESAKAFYGQASTLLSSGEDLHKVAEKRVESLTKVVEVDRQDLEKMIEDFLDPKTPLATLEAHAETIMTYEGGVDELFKAMGQERWNELFLQAGSLHDEVEEDEDNDIFPKSEPPEATVVPSGDLSTPIEDLPIPPPPETSDMSTGIDAALEISRQLEGFGLTSTPIEQEEVETERYPYLLDLLMKIKPKS